MVRLDHFPPSILRLRCSAAGRSVNQAGVTCEALTPWFSAVFSTVSITSHVRGWSLPACHASIPLLGFSPRRVAPMGGTSRLYLPDSQPPHKGDHGNNPMFASRGGDDLQIEFPNQQAVLTLQSYRVAPALAMDCFGQLPSQEVGKPVVGDLAIGDRVVEEAERLLQRCGGIPWVPLGGQGTHGLRPGLLGKPASDNLL